MTTLIAGRELDALIAEKVMGFTLWSDEDFRSGVAHYRDAIAGTLYRPDQWCPSQSLEQAWQVVEKLGNWHGFTFLVIKDEGNDYQVGWYEFGWDGYERRCACDAETVQLAICLAALKAVEFD